MVLIEARIQTPVLHAKTHVPIKFYIHLEAGGKMRKSLIKDTLFVVDWEILRTDKVYWNNSDQRLIRDVAMELKETNEC